MTQQGWISSVLLGPRAPPTVNRYCSGDLHINFGAPQTMQEEIIANFLDNINVINMLCKFVQQGGQRQGKGARWIWRQQRGGRWHQSQPDYIMAREGDTKAFQNMAFQWPRIHDLDHCTVLAIILRGQKDSLRDIARAARCSPCNSH
jgi:hypothetical protein